MLIALMPEQVSEYWGAIKVAIERSAPPIAKDLLDMNRILEAAMSGALQVWAAQDDTGRIVGVVTTALSADICSGGSNLLIYSIYAVGTISRKVWEDSYATLRVYAKSMGCERIVGYTTEPVVRKLVRFFGGDDSFTFITLEV